MQSIREQIQKAMDNFDPEKVIAKSRLPKTKKKKIRNKAGFVSQLPPKPIDPSNLPNAIRIYVLEGPDGAGKTTFANRLKDIWEKAGFQPAIVHSGPKATLEEMYSDAIDELRAGAWPVIMDRSPVSELVYGPVLRGETLGDEEDWRNWWDFIDYFPTEKIHLTAPLDVLQRRAFSRGEDLVNLDQLAEIALKYGEVLRQQDWERLSPPLQDWYLARKLPKQVAAAKKLLRNAQGR